MRTGQRVKIAGGWYRTGRTANSHVAVPAGATGTVRLVYGGSRLNPPRVLVDLDQPANPFAPRTAMVPPTELEPAA